MFSPEEFELIESDQDIICDICHSVVPCVILEHENDLWVCSSCLTEKSSYIAKRKEESQS